MGLQENAKSETVSRLALRDPVTANADDSIRSAIERMRSQKIGCTVIIDEGNKPVGMFTEGMLTPLLAKNPAVVDEPIRNHMADRWPWVRITDPISDVIDALQTKNIRFLCVVDENDKLAGLAGQKGIMEYVADHFPSQVMVQRIGGTPYPQQREGA